MSLLGSFIAVHMQYDTPIEFLDLHLPHVYTQNRVQRPVKLTL